MNTTLKTKKSNLRDFTQGPILVPMLRFAFPLLLANLMMIMLNTVDMVVVGQVEGEVGSSAISIGGQVATFINVFINGFSAAGQIIISRLVGAKERNKISRFIATMMGFLFVAAIAFMAVFIPLNKTVLELLNTPEETFSAAYSYSIICLIGIIPIFAYHAISSVVRGMGDSKHPFLFIFIACGLNIVLDILFVAVFRWGVAGAAIATVIAQLVSVLFSIGFLYIKRAEFELTLRFRDFIFWDKEALSEFLRLGIPLAIKNSAIQISAMIVNSFTNDFGVSVSAFSGIRSNIATTTGLLLGAITNAGTMFIAQSLAAGEFKRVKKVMLRVGSISVSLSLLFSVLILCFPMQIFGIFTSESAVLAIVASYLPIAVLGFLEQGVASVTAALMNGSGNKTINLVVALLDAIVARISLAYIFGVMLDWGYLGFWLGSSLAGIVPILVGVVFFVTGIWKRSAKIKKAA